METTISFEALGHNIEFYCHSHDTRNGFAHFARLYVDGRQCSIGHCYYLNRTWEHWHYQSVCLTACQNYIDVRSLDLKVDFKAERSLSRVSGKSKAELEEIIKNDPDIVLFTEIKKTLLDRSF